MRRASSVFLFRSITSARGGSTASVAVPNRFLQAALYNTASGAGHSRRRWFSSILTAGTTFGVAGALIASVSVSEEALAKEPPPSHALPNDVVLYQYEACPFCNKVKGNTLIAFHCVQIRN